MGGGLEVSTGTSWSDPFFLKFPLGNNFLLTEVCAAINNPHRFNKNPATQHSLSALIV